jgi:hypothetical protein
LPSATTPSSLQWDEFSSYGAEIFGAGGASYTYAYASSSGVS